jgi:hypothetical protein
MRSIETTRVVSIIEVAFVYTVRTLDFQSGNAGSNPARGTTLEVDDLHHRSQSIQCFTNAPLTQRRECRPVEPEAAGSNPARGAKVLPR